ncbi:hypothetical protein SAMN05421878_1322 [Actinobaculum suis]|uniref:Uncharacterized protein n=1 Tax=Actinobaculum suis TaxID=1657 RepID=A0A1G7EZN5_9ACTO|nr:hypothetical protein SAMN05421878_1322 [Actinobaculum suis]VDG75707.1 Uncharacterised protein [Actinobaculum suis]
MAACLGIVDGGSASGTTLASSDITIETDDNPTIDHFSILAPPFSGTGF